MFGLDEQLVELSDEGMVAFALILSFLLGLRHSTDPDHLAAITTLVASDEDRPTRTAGKLGIFWGLGHAVTLAAFGLPVLLFGGFLPSGHNSLRRRPLRSSSSSWRSASFSAGAKVPFTSTLMPTARASSTSTRTRTLGVLTTSMRIPAM